MRCGSKDRTFSHSCALVTHKRPRKCTDRCPRNLIDFVGSPANAVESITFVHTNTNRKDFSEARRHTETFDRFDGWFRSRETWKVSPRRCKYEIRERERERPVTLYRRQKSRWYSLHHARQIVDKGSSGI